MLTYSNHDFDYELFDFSLLPLFFTEILKDFGVSNNQFKLALSLEYNAISANYKS